MSQQKRDKTRDLAAHARRRLRERCDFEGSRSEIERAIDNMVELIQAGKSVFIEKQSNRLSVFRVTFMGKSYFPVYDQTRKIIVTFLTKKMIDDREMNDEMAF